MMELKKPIMEKIESIDSNQTLRSDPYSLRGGGEEKFLASRACRATAG